MGRDPSVKAEDAPSDRAPRKSPVRLPRAAPGRRRLEARSKPFWKIQQEKKQSASEAIDAKSRPFWQIEKEKKQSAKAASVSVSARFGITASVDSSSRESSSRDSPPVDSSSRESSSRDSSPLMELELSWPSPDPSQQPSPPSGVKVNQNFPKRAVISNGRDLDLLLVSSMADIEWPTPPRAPAQQNSTDAHSDIGAEYLAGLPYLTDDLKATDSTCADRYGVSVSIAGV